MDTSATDVSSPTCSVAAAGSQSKSAVCQEAGAAWRLHAVCANPLDPGWPPHADEAADGRLATRPGRIVMREKSRDTWLRRMCIRSTHIRGKLLMAWGSNNITRASEVQESSRCLPHATTSRVCPVIVSTLGDGETTCPTGFSLRASCAAPSYAPPSPCPRSACPCHRTAASPCRDPTCPRGP